MPQFVRVCPYVVELRLGRIDEVILLHFKPAQFAPIEVKTRQKSFRIKRAGFARPFILYQRQKTAALCLPWNSDFQRTQNGRSHIGKAHWRTHFFCHARWQVHDEGDVQRRVVDEKAMSLLTMLSKTFSMIAAKNDKSSLV